MATGTGTVNETTSKIEIENANPAFKCKADSINCHLVERNEEVPIGFMNQSLFRKSKNEFRIEL